MKTGDLGFLDDEGYLHLTGRAKDLIIRGGVNISPVEIDAVLMQRPGGDRGLHRRRAGQGLWRGGGGLCRAAAGRGVGADDILRHCNAALPAFKAPKQIVLSDALPKTERGKLDRKALVERWSREVRGVAEAAFLSPFEAKADANREGQYVSFVPFADIRGDYLTK